MNKKVNLTGIVFFFIWTTVVIETAVLIYDAVASKTQDRRWIALIMFAVIVVLSAICTLIDAIRRRVMVDKPVGKILEATTKIARGDFDQQIQLEGTPIRQKELDEIADKINVMARELRKAEVLNNDFVSNVSHEMKTPLAVISSYAKWLTDDKIKEEDKRRCVDKIIGSVDKLTGLVNNVLQLSKLEHQELEVENKEYYLTAQLERIIAEYEPNIADKGLELECELEDMHIISNDSLLELVWNNLLSNALKFTENGFIKVKLGRSGDCAVVKISDSGCGISPQDGERIFDKFYQCDRSHSVNGNGLGLAMVKQVIDIVGGKISVDSQVGVGTTFTVVLKGVINE